jgi:hypothetical protein
MSRRDLAVVDAEVQRLGQQVAAEAVRIGVGIDALPEPPPAEAIARWQVTLWRATQMLDLLAIELDARRPSAPGGAHALSFRFPDLPPGLGQCVACGARMDVDRWLVSRCPGRPPAVTTERHPTPEEEGPR